ncbi:AGAP005886-PA-like protein [Anopheles sinensis]|uniref:AGAP005886-PA-like protein n=2 Tax=Anopheles sinensis TaxID=74873 RepID=A0A084W2R9_ANOSI|nr:AGAP005886-PA-like protein [Anopheles sinensis]
MKRGWRYVQLIMRVRVYLDPSRGSNHIGSSQFPFNADQVRILVFKECDLRGRKLLFDSSALEKVSSDGNSAAYASENHPASIPQVQKCDHCNVVYRVRKEEIKHFEEMIFGSAPIAFRGSSFKVHWMKTPKTLMCSLVFPAPVPSGAKKSSVSTYPGSELFVNTASGGHGIGSSTGGVDFNPSVSDLSSLGTGSLHSFTVSSSTATQHDPSLLHRHRPVIPAEFYDRFDRFADLRHSSNSGIDSGYGGTDPWALSSSSTRHPNSSSHRSSLSSIYSDFECLRRMSADNFSMDIPPPPNCVSLEGCHSHGSFHRRVGKNLSTSFETRHTIADHVGNLDELGQLMLTSGVGPTHHGPTGSRRGSETIDLNRRKALNGELLSTATNYQGKAPSKRQRLGVAVCVRLNETMLQDTDTFCSEHMTVFESILCRVRVAVEKAYIRWKLFLQIMLGAWHSTQQWLNDLFTAPRLSKPVWLTLSCSKLTDRTLADLASTFMNDLCSLLSLADTKDTNFFISTVITAVLTHHLGWVGTIAAMTSSDDTASSGSKLDLIRREKERMNEITANHPYSVLWAQLGDLYGAVGYPTKLSKTIICGSSQLGNTLEKLLNVLSYFIRCSEIKRTVYVEAFDEANVRTAFISQRELLVSANGGSEPAIGGREKDAKDVRKESLLLKPSGTLPRAASCSSGLVRSATRMKNLACLASDEKDVALEDDAPGRTSSSGTTGSEEVQKALKKNVMNDIPNVLVYRDSRFVRQELRIGNKSMDTGLVMNAREKQYLEARYQIGKVDHPAELAEEALAYDGQHADDDCESVRLSYLITENSLGVQSDTVEPQQRLIWGVEKTKEGIAIEQLKYIHLLRGDYNVVRDAPGEKESDPKNGNEVVFVLGENEMLKDIHRKPGQPASFVPPPLGQPLKHCCRQKINSFDKYRQIAVNFLNRNLPANQHLLDRGTKEHLERNRADCFLAAVAEKEQTAGKGEPQECDVCHQIPTIVCLQTPTNASEMEFLEDLTLWKNCPQDAPSKDCDRRVVAEREIASGRTTGSMSMAHENIPQIVLSQHHMDTLDENDELRAKHPGSVLKLVDIPFPKGMRTTGSGNDENNNNKTDKGSRYFRAGFMPSLFSCITDHYMPDMVLQGTTAPPSKWEATLKRDLNLAARFTLYEQHLTENNAIVANMDTHEVRLHSSQSQVDGDIVGMSQLVSAMLEAVNAMWSAGISAYQCMAFIESKLRELYLQSETIASVMLATDFCTTNSITTAMDITANDMELLLSVASVHTPEASKRYRVLMR